MRTSSEVTLLKEGFLHRGAVVGLTVILDFWGGLWGSVLTHSVLRHVRLFFFFFKIMTGEYLDITVFHLTRA